MPGTGACAIDDVVTLGRHAAEAGAAAMLMLPPFYYKNVSDDGLFAFAATVIERLGGRVPRILLYHFPQMAVIGWSPPLIARLIEAFPDVIVGIKDSSGDKANTLAIVDAHPGFAVFPGTEVFQLEAMARGAAGAITVSANINATAIAGLCADWQGRDAEHRQSRVNELRKAIQGPQQIPRIKAILAAQTGNPDWLNVRPPLVPLTEAERTRLLAEPAVVDLLAATAA
jgi:4-hydroxy-tetrahydrodipicolinate synthase